MPHPLCCSFWDSADVKYYNITHIIQLEPAIAGSRIPGYVAVRIFAPMHGPEPPELATPCAGAARHGSRPASSGKRPRRPGESGISHSQHGCKVSRHRGDSGKDRPQLESCVRPSAWCGNIYPRVAPSGRAVGKYFLPCPCLWTVAAIGWSRIAVPSVSAA